MKPFLHSIKLLFGLVAVGFSLTACYDVENRREVCDYNIQLNYHYNLENHSEENLLENYVSSLTEYIFDASGVLYAVHTMEAEACAGKFKSERTLPAGRYSVIAWGNLNGTCAVNEARIGVTTREQMQLAMANPCNLYPGYQNNGDRLFHAYRTFTVNSKGISRIRVDVTHAHLSLKVLVRWKNSSQAPSADAGELQLQLTGLPSEYTFMPEYISRGGTCREHNCSADDDYRSKCDEVIHHIPRKYRDRNILSHRLNSYVNVDRQVAAEFVSFRLRNDSPAILSLYLLPNTRAGEPVKLMNDVPLGDFFARQNEDLDRALKQEHPIELIVGDDGSVTVQPMDIADWDEGGSIGYR